MIGDFGFLNFFHKTWQYSKRFFYSDIAEWVVYPVNSIVFSTKVLQSQYVLLVTRLPHLGFFWCYLNQSNWCTIALSRLKLYSNSSGWCQLIGMGAFCLMLTSQVFCPIIYSSRLDFLMIFTSILLSGIYSCTNLLSFLVMSSGNLHLFFSVFGLILNFLVEYFLLFPSGAFDPDEFVSDENNDDGVGELFLLFDVFFNFEFGFFFIFKKFLLS